MDLKFDLKNPYPHTAQNIASEILQLLLVVERIKADKDSLQRLRSLAKVRHAFEESPQIRSVKSKAPFHSDSDNLPLSTLCDVLDKGLGATSFSSKSLRFTEYKRAPLRNQDPTTFPEAPEQHQWSNVWTEDIPAIIDSQHYRFENLNRLRLHYPHLQILLAYVHGKELLLAANKLTVLDYSEFVESAQEWVTQKFSYIQTSNLQPIPAHQIAERATERFLSELDAIILQAKRYLNWSFEEGYYFPSTKVEQKEKEWKDSLGRNLGKQPVLSVELLRADVKRAISEGDLRLIAKEIAQSLAHQIRPNEFDLDFIYSREYQQSLHDTYEQYSTCHTQLLQHANDGLQLNYNTLLRGIGFSIWREKHQEKTGKKTAVLEVAKTFLKEEEGQPYAEGKPNTIKQFHEKVKGYAKRSESKNKPSRLVELIRSQMTARLPFYEPKIRYVFAPLNIGYEEKVRKIAYNLASSFGLEISHLSYEDISELLRSLSSKDIYQLKRDDLIEELRERRVGSLNHQRLDRNRLAELLKEDIWVGD